MINKKNKKQLISLVATIVFVALFLVAKPAQANWVLDLFGGICMGIVSVLGWVLMKLMGVLVYIAQYNNFIASKAVVNGWVMVRDICNMFFVMILLIIAFATILHLENYSYKKWLPKLILMAILINFSKTICGLLIDLAQIVMLTFVNAFKDIGGVNLTDMLGIKDWQTIKQDEVSISGWEVASAYMLAVLYVIISIIVIASMIAMLVMRIVMIWIYVVLSPAAYLLSAFPGGQKYASEWWSEFIKNLIVGPVLAFFIWLSFTSLTNFDSSQLNIDGTGLQKNEEGTQLNCQSTDGNVCDFGTSDVLIKFIISIGMLLGGMKITQDIGGVAGKAAGSVFSKGKKLAIAGAAGAGLLALKGAKQPLSWGVDKIHHATGVDLNVARTFRGFVERRKELKEKQYSEGQKKAGEAMEKGGLHGVLAMSGNPGDAWDEITDWKGLKPKGILKRVKSVGARRLIGGKGIGELKAEGITEKESATRALEDAKYKNDFIKLTPEKRQEKLEEVVVNYNKADAEFKEQDKLKGDLANEIKAEEAKGQYKDEGRISELEDKKKTTEANMKSLDQERKMWSGRTTFVGNNIKHTFTDKEKFDVREELSDSKAKVDSAQEKIDKNTMGYAYEARAAEQASVQAEGKKISSISDPTELVRILRTAIESKDKSLVKATMLKLTKDYNDNEALQPLVGDTSYKGLQELMRQLSTAGSKNYAGFSQEEAFGLGSQVAELNKQTNHWGATSAYVMENGKWRETTEKEHVNIRSKDTDKIQTQAFLRNNNRLAYGKHDEKGEFQLDVGGVMMLKSIDNVDGHKNLNTMNRSAAKYVYDAIIKNPQLEKVFSRGTGEVDKNGHQKTFLDMLEQRLGSTKDQNTMQLYDEAKRDLG